MSEADAPAQRDADAPAPARASTNPVKSVAKALIWPLRRFFDPRFQGLAQQERALHADLVSRVEQAADQASASRELMTREIMGGLGEVWGTLAAEMEARSEETTVLGRSLADLLGETDRLRELVASAQGDAITVSYVERVIGGRLEELDERLAEVLNFAGSHRGFAAQRNLWFTPPIVLEHGPRDVRVSVVNERIAEVPYVLRASGSLAPGAQVLDVGAAESTLAFSLAALGYQVTALDLHPYPLEHPNLRAVQAAVQDWATDETFDAVTCVSTIEHIGLGAYGEARSAERADLAAMSRIRELTRAGGLLVLTTPYGVSGKDEVQRTYDRSGLDELLEGWNVEDLTIISHVDSTTWVSDDASDDPGEHVAMITARRA